MTDINKEERAFDLLQWVPFSLESEFYEEQAILGHYTKTQKARSDHALDAWDVSHPTESSNELTAFKELERLGVYTQADFYSPSKAKDGHYTGRIKALRDSARKPQGPSGPVGPSRSTRKHRPL